MMGLSWQEWAAVTAVGAGIGLVATKGAGLQTQGAAQGIAAVAIPTAIVAGSYVAGYAARQARPEEGYPALTMR